MRMKLERQTGGLWSTVAALACGAILSLGGCKSTPNPYETPPPTKRVLTLTHHVGGTHYCTTIYDGVWYQTFGCSLLLFDTAPVAVAINTELPTLDTIELADFGTAGPATDMALLGDRLFIVLERSAVIELSLTDPWSPKELRRVSAKDLGIKPEYVSVADGKIYVSGEGGIVRLVAPTETLATPAKSDKPQQQQQQLMMLAGVSPVMKHEGHVGRVVMTPMGLATTVGRRIVSVPDQKYLGSANEVIALPASLGGPDAVAYRWESEDGTVVGLMGPDLRERSRVAFPGKVHSVKAIGNKLWVVSDSAIAGFTLADNALKEVTRIAVFGARDVGVINDNYLAVAGSFGRAPYRIKADNFGPGDTFLASHREASGLDESLYDGRFVLAGSVKEGFWLYEVERSVRLADKTVMTPNATSRSAKTVRGTATIDEAGNMLTVQYGSQSYQFSPTDHARMLCVTTVDGDIWVGTEDGLIVLNGDTPAAEVIDTVRIPGPVNALYTLRVGGGAVYVSRLGGFGVVRWLLEELPFPD